MKTRYKPVGWRGESRRHYLAAKGIKTKYFSRFKQRTELPGRGVEYTNPEGKKIIYAPGFTDVVKEGKIFPTPDDLSYMYDELSPELTPANTVLVTKKGLAKTHAQLKIASDLAEDESKEDYLKVRIATSENKFMRDLYKRDLADLQEARKEGSFSRRTNKELKKLEYVSGQQSNRDAINDKIFILPSDRGEGFVDQRSTFIHEQGHAVDASLDHPTISSEGNVVWPFKSETAPTSYGTSSKIEDFAESFTLGINPSGSSKELRWNEKERERTKKSKDMYGRFASEDDKDKKFWKTRAERLKNEIETTDAAQKEYPDRIDWMEQNVPGWSAPSAREREEAIKSPKVLAAEALSKSGVEVKPGEFMVRK